MYFLVLALILIRFGNTADVLVFSFRENGHFYFFSALIFNNILIFWDFLGLFFLYFIAHLDFFQEPIV